MRRLLVFLRACLIFNGLQGRLCKVGLGRLPGDSSFRLGGRDWYVPLASSAVMRVLEMLIGLRI